MKYLVIGKYGQLGRAFSKEFDKRAENYISIDYEDVDIGNFQKVIEIFEEIKPDIVINCAAYNYVDLAETDKNEYQLAYMTNSIGVRNLAFATEKYGSFLIHYSTDYVFDGKKENILYTEEDSPSPLCNYAKSKHFGEMFLEQETNKYLLFRVSWLYGEGKQNFIYKLLQWAKKEGDLKVPVNETSIPTSVSTVVWITLESLKKGLKGLYHCLMLAF